MSIVGIVLYFSHLFCSANGSLKSLSKSEVLPALLGSGASPVFDVIVEFVGRSRGVGQPKSSAAFRDAGDRKDPQSSRKDTDDSPNAWVEWAVHSDIPALVGAIAQSRSVRKQLRTFCPTSGRLYVREVTD